MEIHHIFSRAIWDKLPQCIFEKFAIAQVKQGQIKIFKNQDGNLSPKLRKRNM